VPLVRTTVDVPQASLSQVWQVVCEFERYPAVMRDVLEVRFHEQSGTEAVSSWRVLLNGSELTWTERDVFVAPHRIDFDQTEGDLEVFRGAWLLEEIDDGVRVTLDVEFDLGIPSLAAVLDPVGIQAIRSNSESMLRAISQQHAPLSQV